MYTAYLRPAKSASKKWTAVIFENGRKVRTVHFGAAGMSDYTIHKDPCRMERYTVRHRARENWTITGVVTPGFWAKWLLWGEPSISASIKEIERRFPIRIMRGEPPTSLMGRSPGLRS